MSGSPLTDEDGDRVNWDCTWYDGGIVELRVDLNQFNDPEAARAEIINLCGTLSTMLHGQQESNQ